MKTLGIYKPRYYVRIFFFSALWLFGMLLGFIASRRTALFLSDLRSNLFSSEAFWAASLLATTLPYILTFFLFYIKKTHYLFLIILPKSFLYFFCFFCMYFVYPGAGWLARLLFMFSGSVNALLLLWFWITCLSDNRFPIKQSLFCIVVCFILCSIEHTVISSLVSQVITI